MLVTNGFFIMSGNLLRFLLYTDIHLFPYSTRKYSSEINMQLHETKYDFKRTTLLEEVFYLKRLIIILVAILFIFGCKKDESNVIVSTELPPVERSESSNEVKDVKIPSPYFARSEEFDRVIGWISETEIMFLEKNVEGFHVYTYDINSNIKTHHATVELPINDVMIHPSKSHFTLLMSENSLQAIIAIYEMGGTKVDELTIESSEIVFEWHPSQVELMTVTAFYEDWTFDTFMYSSKTQILELISSTQPFLEWASSNELVGVEWKENDALSGGSLTKISISEGSISKSRESNYIFVDYFEDLSLTVQIDQERELFIYKLYDLKNKTEKIFKTPAISNYSQWFIPEIIWTNQESFLTYISPNSGLLDVNQSRLKLMEFSFKPENDRVEFDEGYVQLICSPNGEYCLKGEDLFTISNLHSGQELKWMEYITE